MLPDTVVLGPFTFKRTPMNSWILRTDKDMIHGSWNECVNEAVIHARWQYHYTRMTKHSAPNWGQILLELGNIEEPNRKKP